MRTTRRSELAATVAVVIAFGCGEANPRYRASDAGVARADGDVSAPAPHDADAPHDAATTPPSDAGGTTTPPSDADPSRSHLVGYWRFDDGPGSATAADASGRGQTGALVGLPPASAWVAARDGYALRWAPGEVAGVRIVPSAALDELATAFTISAWVYREGTSATFGSIVSRRCGDTNRESYNVTLLNGDVRLFMNCGDPSVDMIAPDASPDRTWIHVVATFDATAVRLYVNDALVATAIPASATFLHTDDPIYIGNNKNGVDDVEEPMHGRIDDVAIWNRALSPFEVGLLYGGADPRTL